MSNERKTEAIVRNHFQKDAGVRFLEEQKSDSPKIAKLLKTASKSGGGSGSPEFIITPKDSRELLLIVECKADSSNHESITRDQYSKFAVDGVLLYASHLAKEFDVLAIAVSGETKRSARISHFLNLKGEIEAVPIFGDSLLPISDYLQGYLKSPEKIRQDYNTLLDFSRDLNEKLHTHKILESERSLLISCILIALEHKAFRAAYKEYTEPDDLANFLVTTVISNLRKAGLQKSTLENLEIRFSFIKTDTSLSKKADVLCELITDIDENVNHFLKNHEFLDVLGQLYIEFLRYANSDKGLGIVLTPPHITELFCDLARVNKDTVVYDNCAGTGGFLISAMGKMIADAKGDLGAEAKIKSSQIVGVEYQSHIFALACSNMYIHQDGKTNIINGDCFDESVVQAVRAKRPSVGMLNPPYKADRKRDTEELEFVLNNLACLELGGTCVAIVPMQSAISISGKILELKSQILSLHTLEAVLSMPNELFFNSNVGVVSSVMVITAHKPHPANKETYFGYYKDDGFVKRKGKGRIDALNAWNAKKEKWLDYYLNRKEEAGFSVNRVVSANEEWCAEAYMETDYSELSADDFASELKKYVAFQILNQ